MSDNRDLDILVKAAIEGDKGAEEALFSYLLVRFGLFARHRIRDRQAAEDVASKACTVILERYRQEAFSVSFESWSWGVLRMTIRSYFQQLGIEKARMSYESLDDSGLAGEPHDPTLVGQLLGCLRQLCGIDRRFARVLNLAYQGFKTDEICRRLDVSSNYYYVLLHRGRSFLKQCLQSGIAGDETDG